MIELRTPYGSFDLGPDFKISIVDENNALEWSNTIKVERAYPTTLPWTPTNAQIWMHADIAESHSDRLKVQCDLVVDGNTEFRGVCNLLQTIEGRSYSINITYNNELIQPEKLITDIEYTDTLSEYSAEEGYQVWNVDVTGMIDGDGSTHKYACPVTRQDHKTYEYLNHWDLTTQQYLDGNIVPMFYLRYVLQQVAQSWGYKLIGSIDSDTELLKVLIFNCYNYSAGQYVTGPIYFMTDQELLLKNHLPKISISQLMSAVRIRFCCGTHIDTANGILNIYSLRDVLTKKKKVDITSYVKGRGYAEITPDNGGDTYEQTQDDADTHTQYVRPTVPTNYKGSVANLFALFSIVGATAGDVYLVENTDYYWVYNGTTWIFYQYRLHELNLGPNKITDSSGAVMCDTMYDGSNSDTWKTLRTAYPIEDVENNTVDPTLRFCIYQGMQNPSARPLQYPMASIDHKDTNLTDIGEMDLRDDGEYGLYNRYKIWRKQLLSNRRKPTLMLKECNPILHKMTPDTILQVQSQEYLWIRKTRNYNLNQLIDVELEVVKL